MPWNSTFIYYSVSSEMDIIHGFSNFEIETASSSSQEDKEVEVLEKGGKTDWLELPQDLMCMILMKLGTIDILVTAQWVCTTWWKLSKQPHLLHSITMQQPIWVPPCHGIFPVVKPPDHLYALGWPKSELMSKCELMRMVKMAKEAIDRSCGQLVEISVRHFANDELLEYISQKSKSLRCLCLVYCNDVTDKGLKELCKQFPQLEELELSGCSIAEASPGFFGSRCPHLKSFRLNYMRYNLVYLLEATAVAISFCMPELRHLSLFGNMLTDRGVRCILRNCPHLQSLDLRRCFNVKFEGDYLKEMSANIKIRLPYDPVDDFEYAFDEDEFNIFIGEVDYGLF